MGDNISVADALALTKNGGFGNGGVDILILFIIFAMFGGGFGGFGRGNFGVSEVEAGFRNNAVINKLDGITQGLCDTAFALSNEIGGVRTAIAECCCNTNRNIDSLKYDMSQGLCNVMHGNAMNTRDILENQNNNTQRIIDTINNNVNQDLRDKLTAASNVIESERQSRFILDQLGRYVTNPPCSPCGQYY